MSINCVSTKKADNQSCADYPPIMSQKKRKELYATASNMCDHRNMISLALAHEPFCAP